MLLRVENNTTAIHCFKREKKKKMQEWNDFAPNWFL